MSDADVAIVGGGPAGLLMALLLARRGARVDVHERRPDPRSAPAEAGRSINLALASRGLVALESAGLTHLLEGLIVPMVGRRVHEPGATPQLVPYGQAPNERIHSISRATLTLRLTEAAGATPGIRLAFDQRCTGLDADARPIVRDAGGTEHRLVAPRVIAADGAGSAVRAALAARGAAVDEALLDHDYKELLMPAALAAGRLDREALHVWPRGGFMLIALPNADGSFTATLFLPREGADSFASLRDDAAVDRFFAREFDDVVALLPDLAAQFRTHPQSRLGTVHATPWNVGERLLLIGDAAHAIVPFHGQGMNCAFEDCRLLDALLHAHPHDAFERFARDRPRDTDAIATMALENYGEMRDTVRDPRFLRQKALSLELERRHPTRFVPRYAMVMFRPDIPYAVAFERGRVQQRLLDDLTTGDGAMDFAAAARRIEAELAPI